MNSRKGRNSNNQRNSKLIFITAQKIKFSIKDFFSKCDQPKPQLSADLVIFTEETFNAKLHFLCSVYISLRVKHDKLEGKFCSHPRVCVSKKDFA